MISTLRSIPKRFFWSPSALQETPLGRWKRKPESQALDKAEDESRNNCGDDLCGTPQTYTDSDDHDDDDDDIIPPPFGNLILLA